jgi:type IV pilus assembly protein PilY1
LVVRVRDNLHPTGGRWVAVFGNGPESGAQRAALFVVDLETGAKVAILDTGDGDAANPNGLSAPAPLLDSNRQLIGVYAGDLRGNLWKFDLSGPNPSTWSVAFGGAPMFQARDRNGKRQPIHARPLIVPHPAGGVLVVFGTGKIFSPGDRENADEQTLYGVRDNLAGNPAIDANFRSGSVMVQQAITEKSGLPATYYLTSFPVDYSAAGGKRGWFLDLGVRYSESGSGLDPSSATLVTPGERMVSMPSVLGDTLLALSLVPGTDPCSAGGVSFLYALNFLTGSFVGARSFAGDRSGAVQTVAGSGLLPFLMRGRARHGDGVPGTGQPPVTPPPNQPPPPCQPGFEPVWVVPQAGGPGHWECVPVGNARDVRTWRQIIE